MPPDLLTVFRDAALVVALSVLLALVTNTVRSRGKIPLVAEQDYAILVPCPEHLGQPARPLSPAQFVVSRGTLVVDARETSAFDAWHLPGAISIPYDYLEPKPEERKILDARAQRVVVYGDGAHPDSGQQLANAISGKGLKNVFYIAGGASALKAQGDRVP